MNSLNRIVYKWLRPSTNVTLLNSCGGFSDLMYSTDSWGCKCIVFDVFHNYGKHLFLVIIIPPMINN